MADREGLLALAERVEQASVATYVLDLELWDARYPSERDTRFTKVNASCGGRLGPADKNGYVQPLASLSGSLDAVFRHLVPEGWTVAHISQGDNKRWHVELRQGHLTSYREVVIVPSKYAPHELRGVSTLPLALAAAALRARAQMEEANAKS